MIRLNVTGKLSPPTAFLDSSLNITTGDERLDTDIYNLLAQIQIPYT
jgi:hypothetical protein